VGDLAARRISAILLLAATIAGCSSGTYVRNPALLPATPPTSCFSPDSGRIAFGYFSVDDSTRDTTGNAFVFSIVGGTLRGSVQEVRSRVRSDLPLDTLAVLPQGDTLFFSYHSGRFRYTFWLHVTCTQLLGRALLFQSATHPSTSAPFRADRMCVSGSGQFVNCPSPRHARTRPECPSLPDSQSKALGLRLESFADSAGSVEAKIDGLRTLFPQVTSFAGYYGTFCSLGSPRRLTPHAYYYLLDTLATAAVARQFGTSAVTETPMLIAPEDSAIFDIFRRVTVLRWGTVDSAATYLVEIEVFLPTQKHLGLLRFGSAGEFRPLDYGTGRVTVATADTINFAGAQPGRWRVRGLDRKGRPGPASAWRVFEYLK